MQNKRFRRGIDIDKTLEDKRLKELTAADRWFDDL
jgi:hypothetical protein